MKWAQQIDEALLCVMMEKVKVLIPHTNSLSLNVSQSICFLLYSSETFVKIHIVSIDDKLMMISFFLLPPPHTKTYTLLSFFHHLILSLCSELELSTTTTHTYTQPLYKHNTLITHSHFPHFDILNYSLNNILPFSHIFSHDHRVAHYL